MPRPNRNPCILWLNILLALGLSFFVLVSCSWEDRDREDAANPANMSMKTAVSKAGKAASTDTYTFAIIYPMPHALYEMVTSNAEETANQFGVKLIVKAPDEANLEQQIRMMETLIRQGVDGIAIDPINPDALKSVINKAVSAGIPVICFESDAPDSKRLSYIGSDNRESGKQMGARLDRLMKGKGMILIESGMSDMLSLRQRLDGLLQYLEDNTDIQVLDIHYNEGNEDVAITDMEQMIDEHPHFDALVALDVMSSSNSILIWKAKGLTRYALSFGMTAEIRDAIGNGQITATVSQGEFNWGTEIVNRLLQAKQGRIPPFIDTGIALFENSLEIYNLKLD